MAGSDLLVVLLKHTVAVLALLLVLRALAGASAARRVFAARCGMAALLLAPLLWLAVPVLRVGLPHAWTAWLEPATPLPPLAWLASAPVRAAAFEAPLRAADHGRILLWVYGAGVLLLLLRTGVGLVQLARMRAGAARVDAPAWTEQLVRLQAHLGMTRPVQLLVSSRAGSPLSWGWRKPVIVLDPHTLATAAPDAVLAHELAHIARHDWPAMLLARVLVALYWWHPLMHFLYRRLAHDAECAADDSVLAAGVAPSAYAQTLLSVSRHAFGAAPASRMAGRGAVLVARIGALLAPHQARAQVTRAQWLAGSVATAFFIVLVGGMVQRGERVVWPEHLLAGPGAPASASPEALLEALDNPNFTQLARAMRSGQFAQRHAPGGASFRQRAAIPALVLGLQDARPAVRRLAAWGLSELRFPETAPALAAMLADRDPAVRAEAAAALGDLGEARWLAALHALLSDPDPDVAAQAAWALAELE